MKKNVSSLVFSVAFMGLIAYGAVTNVACSDDNNDNINITTGRGGTSGGVGGAGGSDRSISTYTVSLSAGDEVPTNSSGGSGNVVVTLRSSSGGVAVAGEFRGLSSDAVAAEIRGPAGKGDTAPVILTFSVTGGRLGVINGTGTISSDMVTAMKNGQTYVNITTTIFPDGEIRGQITP